MLRAFINLISFNHPTSQSSEETGTQRSKTIDQMNIRKVQSKDCPVSKPKPSFSLVAVDFIGLGLEHTGDPPLWRGLAVRSDV